MELGLFASALRSSCGWFATGNAVRKAWGRFASLAITIRARLQLVAIFLSCVKGLDVEISIYFS